MTRTFNAEPAECAEYSLFDVFGVFRVYRPGLFSGIFARNDPSSNRSRYGVWQPPQACVSDATFFLASSQAPLEISRSMVSTRTRASSAFFAASATALVFQKASVSVNAFFSRAMLSAVLSIFDASTDERSAADAGPTFFIVSSSAF